MSTTAFYIAAGTLLGLVQMVLGIWIGLWIRRGGRGSGDSGELDQERAAELLGRLTELASGLSEDVQGHQARMTRINDRLVASKAASPSSLSEIVVGVVGEVLRANCDLQQRLSSAEAQLQQQSHDLASYATRALTDELTGLPNRRAFDDQLRQRLAAFERHRLPFSLLLVDIDYFKAVNDTHGHVAGDRLLASIATTLRAAMRKADLVARYGGEEFAVLLPYTTLEEGTHAARHARQAIEAAAMSFDRTTITVTASVGLASVRDEDDATSIVKRADEALYASKSGGRNCGHLHDGSACVRITEPIENVEKVSGIFSAAEKVPDTFSGSAALPKAAADALQSRPPISPDLAAACAVLRGSAASQMPDGEYCKL